MAKRMVGLTLLEAHLELGSTTKLPFLDLSRTLRCGGCNDPERQCRVSQKRPPVAASAAFGGSHDPHCWVSQEVNIDRRGEKGGGKEGAIWN